MPAVVLGAPAIVVGSVADGAAVAAGDPPVLVAGTDGTNVQTIRVATDGTVRTDPTGTTTQPISGTVAVSGTVPVSAASLPLPTGAATEATLALIKAKTDNLDVALSTRAVTGLTDAQLRASPVPTSVTSLPLPAGAATEATLALIKAKTDNLDVALSTRLNTLGQKTKANSAPVTFASDQDALAIYLASPSGSRTGIITSSITLGGGTANTLQRVNLTTYNEQTANATRSVKSNSASDTSAGTGARTIQITYYDATLDGPFTTNVTMNGLTAVATSVSNICFIESIFVLTVGSGGANAGTITLYTDNAGAGTVITSIGFAGIVSGTGDNRTFLGHHYVPVGIVATLATFVVSADSGGSGTSCEFFFKSRNPLLTNSPDVIVSDLLLSTGVIVRVLSFPVKVFGPARVAIFAVPFVNNAHLNASIDFSEVAV